MKYIIEMPGGNFETDKTWDEITFVFSKAIMLTEYRDALNKLGAYKLFAIPKEKVFKSSFLARDRENIISIHVYERNDGVGELSEERKAES